MDSPPNHRISRAVFWDKTTKGENLVLTSEEITSFYGQRPDGVAFDAKGKQCIFLEFTRPIDPVTSSDEWDWAERKELEKSERYGMRLYFINYLKILSGRL